MDEGWHAKEKGGARRWGPVRVSWEGDTKVGGWHTWEGGAIMHHNGEHSTFQRAHNLLP